ncbi:MAG: SURF1 family protein [Hyphomicrobiaceae bacterium]|nr:SURF1 family protein [Hyphomicrobiaceae bacterium]
MNPEMKADGPRGSLLWPTVLTLIGLAILLSLGTWQMRRLAWKEALIARVEAGAKAAPKPLGEVLADVIQGKQPFEEAEFRRVSVSGRFDHVHEFHVWAPGKIGPAWSVVTPLELSTPLPAAPGAQPAGRVLVIRGVVPEHRKAREMRAAGNPEGVVEIVGRTRIGRTGTFSGGSNPEHNQWYSYDSAGMIQALGAGTPVAAVLVEAETAAGGADAPKPELGAINLTNRHLEYALTWYGLALTLIGVYVAYAVSRGRRRAA